MDWRTLDATHVLAHMHTHPAAHTCICVHRHTLAPWFMCGGGSRGRDSQSASTLWIVRPSHGGHDPLQAAGAVCSPALQLLGLGKPFPAGSMAHPMPWLSDCEAHTPPVGSQVTLWVPTGDR